MTWKIFWQLVRRDLLVFKKEYFGKVLDILISFTVWIIVFGYFVPKMGSSDGYGVFIMVGAIASFGVFEIIGQCGTLIMDIQNDKTISYLLMLPVSSTVIFAYRAFSWALQSLLISVPLYFVGKALFWKQVNLGQVNWVYLPIAFFTINFFLGTFSLWLVSVLHKVRDLTRVYFRFINPLFMFGCYFYTWKVAFELAPSIGIVSLIDPFCYIMEMIRATILGPEGYIPFWASFAALWGFIALFGWIANMRLKKILDCL